jgi:hypothetical protein
MDEDPLADADGRKQTVLDELLRSNVLAEE